MHVSRTADFRAISLILCLIAGCASKYAPTQRMASIQASLDKDGAAQIFAKALSRSQTASGLCRAAFSWDDPKPAATREAFLLQVWRRGEEIGRTKEKDYSGKESTVIAYRKDRYAEERRFGEIEKIRISKEVTGICVDVSARGRAAITLHMGRVEVPIVFAVSDVDTVVAALAVLAPQATIIEGAGL
jgi:hypothetical protein